MATTALSDPQVPVTNGADSSSPSPPPPYSYEADELSLVQIVRFFLRHWLLIGGMALAAGFTAALYMAFSVPRTYEASATLVIVSPRFSSELKQPTLTVQGYQKLLESDAVLAETKKRLVQQSVLAEKETLRLGGNMETRIFISQKSDTTSLAPMLQTVARGKTSAQAAAIANTWAQVFLERIHDLMAGSTSAAVQFIDVQYPQAQDQLTQTESERNAAANEFQKRHDGAATSWDEKLSAFQNETANLVATFQNETAGLVAAFQNETAGLVATFQNETTGLVAAFQNETANLVTVFQNETANLVTVFQNETADLVATHQAETTRLVEEFTSQRNLGTREAQSKSLYGAYGELQSEQARVSTLLQQKQLQLDATRQQLAQAPEYLTLEKAISDDALWQSLALQKNQKIDWKALQGRSLLTQQVNPVYTELSSRLLQSEMEVNALIPRGTQLSQELARMSASIQELDMALNAEKAEGEKLHQEREAGLAKLKLQRETELRIFTRERDLKQTALTRERETQFASFTRVRDLKQTALTRERETQFASFTRERDGQKTVLAKGRENQLAVLTRQQKQELDALARERDGRITQLDRQVGRLKDLYSELAKNYNQATLAKAQQEVEDVRLGAAAVPPDSPAPRGLAMKSLLALIVGGLVGLFAAALSDMVAAARSET